MSPLIIELDPLRGAGPVLLGMPFEEAGRALATWGTPRPFAPYPGAEPLDWLLSDSRVRVYVFCGSRGVVQRVEITRYFDDPDVEPPARVLLLGMDVFSVPAEQVIAELGARYHVDDDVGGAAVRELSVGLSYPTTPFPSEDLECFNCVLIAGPGYYDPPPPRGGAS